MGKTPKKPKKSSVPCEPFGRWFEEFHAANPHVYAHFRALAYEIRNEGHTRYGSKTIMERLRWESPVRYGNEFKMGNKEKDRATARYVRMLIEEDPSFEYFFETRRLTHVDWFD